MFRRRFTNGIILRNTGYKRAEESLEDAPLMVSYWEIQVTNVLRNV